MTIPKLISSPHLNYLSLYGLTGLFWVNEWMIRSRALRSWIWQLLLIELYYVSGQCQHSGHCCSNLQIDINGKPVDTPKKLAELQRENPEYRRFFFNSGNLSEGKPTISCRSLSNNWCSDYHTRPSICHHYPFNRFFNDGFIHQRCGYQVKRKQGAQFDSVLFSHPQLKSLMFRVEFLNNI